MGLPATGRLWKVLITCEHSALPGALQLKQLQQLQQLQQLGLVCQCLSRDFHNGAHGELDRVELKALEEKLTKYEPVKLAPYPSFVTRHQLPV